jgi:hypothetical protein
MDAKQLRKASAAVNKGLYQLGLKYWNYIPVYEIDSLLVDSGFAALESGIYTGHDGRSNEEVGFGKYLSMSWHRMESRRLEIVAYIS